MQSEETGRLLDEQHRFDPATMEPVPAAVAARRCVEIRGLTKVFDTKDGPITAVDNLSVSMYEGQIFALLGHNGAGKSTTVSMLTGLYPPTSGDCFAFGTSITTDMDSVRQMLGVCPQHDTLFPRLTVREHLEVHPSYASTSRGLYCVMCYSPSHAAVCWHSRLLSVTRNHCCCRDHD